MSKQPNGPPYAPRVASVGGTPSVIPDVPACATMLAIYLSFAVANMTIFQRNRIRKYKFLPTIFIFGFCMARVATLVLRIAWSTRQHNVRLAIAANILVNAGILIVYVLNLIFAQRILRAEQPRLGWHPAIKVSLTILYSWIGGALVMVITATVISVYTLKQSTLRAVRDVQLAAITFLLVFTTLPLLTLAFAELVPRKDGRETFGQGSMLKKKLIVAAVGCLSVTISGFSAGTAWMPARPITRPAWYHSKAAFYVFHFTLEILILCVLTFSRVDKLFFVPNGSKKPGDYTRLRSEPANKPGREGTDGDTKVVNKI